MTNEVEKAMEYLKYFKENEYGLGTTTLDLAIQALEKQVGKVPLNIDIPEYKYGAVTATCAKCGSIVDKPLTRDKYCSNCGQKIDWSE